ncbi:hypothetical protein B0F90DRAFT_222249 [Multifurca ochricompacta]|uniref:LysM domain-containing protein n=1 Tax=Multifurca ochricompacta TaxID=376703 RepID=A0AAD4LYG2_9AGAM|nr:hypothetical protein B0F90DRAFT_222249 [Multifurca ochricompacta]
MLSFSTATHVFTLILCLTLSDIVRATGPRVLCVERYRISQGDTCASIAPQLGLNQSDVESMNPGVNCSSSALPSGKSLCTRAYTPVCTLNATATQTTCDELAATWEITVNSFVAFNDDVDDACDDLVVGNTYCVSTDGCYPGHTDPICDQ